MFLFVGKNCCDILIFGPHSVDRNMWKPTVSIRIFRFQFLLFLILGLIYHYHEKSCICGFSELLYQLRRKLHLQNKRQKQIFTIHFNRHSLAFSLPIIWVSINVFIAIWQKIQLDQSFYKFNSLYKYVTIAGNKFCLKIQTSRLPV